MNTSTLVGSPKQKSYALSILKKAAKRYPDVDLLSISVNAGWWIANAKQLDDILGSEQTNGYVVSPFTYTFPRYSRSDAINALKQLDDFIVLDCESTGVGKGAEVCELAIVDYRSGDVLFNSLLHPYNLDGYDTSKAREVNGISSALLCVAPSLPEVWPDVLAILQSKHVTSFNTQFDLPLIRGSVQIWDIEVPPIPATCLMKLTTAFLERDFYVSLDEASSFFCVEPGMRHRALGDCLTTIEVIRAMKHIAESEQTNGH